MSDQIITVTPEFERATRSALGLSAVLVSQDDLRMKLEAEGDG